MNKGDGSRGVVVWSRSDEHTSAVGAKKTRSGQILNEKEIFIEFGS